MLTAALTAAIAAVMSFFGVKPGPYLVVVAVVLKLLIVALGLFIAWRLGHKKKSKVATLDMGQSQDRLSRR